MIRSFRTLYISGSIQTLPADGIGHQAREFNGPIQKRNFDRISQIWSRFLKRYAADDKSDEWHIGRVEPKSIDKCAEFNILTYEKDEEDLRIDHVPYWKLKELNRGSSRVYEDRILLHRTDSLILEER